MTPKNVRRFSVTVMRKSVITNPQHAKLFAKRMS